MATKFDHEDLLIMEWIDRKIDRSILEAIKEGKDWTPIRLFLHDHESFDKQQCCHFESKSRCHSTPEYVSYNTRVDGCLVWCSEHKPDNADELPGFPAN